MQKNKHGVYEYKRRVPKDLLQSYPHIKSGQIKFSLKTKDRDEANRLIKQYDASYEREFESHRKKNVVPMETRQEFVKRLRHLCLDVGGDVDLETLHATLEWIEEAQAKDEPTPFEKVVLAPASALVDEPEKVLAKNRKAEYQKIIETLHEMIKAFQGEASNFHEVERRYGVTRTIDRFQRHMKILGAEVEAVSTTKATKAVSSGKTLSDILPLWKNEQKPTGNSELEWNTAVKRFEQYFGKLPIDRIESSHIRQFRDALETVPKWSGKNANFKKLVEESKSRTDQYERLAPATINKNLTAISSLLNIAIEYDLLSVNPANRIKVKEKIRSKEKRMSFDKSDLQKLFQSPLYTGCASEDKRHVAGDNFYKDAKYWIPLLALYTGARIEELAQALFKDIKREVNVVYLDINPHGHSKKSVKTASSIRKVPLHKDVLNAGFMEYIAHLERSKAERLFPDLELASKNTYSQPVSKWFTRFRREIGITNPKKTFHSFRHTFKDMCREAGLSQEIHDALTGHGKATVSNSYGSGFSLKVLNDAVQKIENPVSIVFRDGRIKEADIETPEDDLTDEEMLLELNQYE